MAAAAAAVMLGTLVAASGRSDRPATASVTLAPDSMPRLATIDERFQSYNVEMAEVVGGKFWKPYDRAALAAKVDSSPAHAMAGGAAPMVVGQDTSMFQARAPIDLASARLRTLAAALGPAYMRTSGTWANSVYFHDSDSPPPASAPKGFDGVLSRAQWKSVIDFAKAANAKLVTSFTISAGVRDSAGVWTPVEARKILAYTKSIGGEIAGAEFFNEPNMPTYGGAPVGYDAASYARDFAVFRPFVRAAAPRMQIVGPGSVGEGILIPPPGSAGAIPGMVSTEDMLSASPRPRFDIYSYHIYGAASIRCASMGPHAQTSADSALSEEWLARTDRAYAFYVTGLRDRFEPDARAVWVTETADAACGGNPWAATFLDTFRYVDQMGRLARHGDMVLFHNTLASSEYGLLAQNDFSPRPNYWAALLWRRLMGTTVLDAGSSRPGLHLYAHCLRDHPGGVTLLAINTSRTASASIDIPEAAERYTLSARTLRDTNVQLNGRPLALGANDALPTLAGTRIESGNVAVAPATITFLAIAGASNAHCR
jgi:hypothetical protein